MSEGGISRRTFFIGLVCVILISIIGTLLVIQFLGVALRAAPAPEAPMLTFAHWDVTWRVVKYLNIRHYVLFAGVGTSEFSPTFDNNWGYGAPFEDYSDEIGFEATMEIKVQRDAPLTFTVGSDDGLRFSIDGERYVDSWYAHGYSTSTVTVELDEGFHTLTLEWFEWSGYARVSFSCSATDIFIYYP